MLITYTLLIPCCCCCCSEIVLTDRKGPSHTAKPVSPPASTVPLQTTHTHTRAHAQVRWHYGPVLRVSAFTQHCRASPLLFVCMRVRERARQTEWVRETGECECVCVCVFLSERGSEPLLAALWPAERLSFDHSLHKYPQQCSHQAAGTSLSVCIPFCLRHPFLPLSYIFGVPLKDVEGFFCFVTYSEEK